MDTSTVVGVVVVIFAGLAMGSVAWPMKLMRKFKFEHWWLIGMFVGLIVLPWFVTLAFCPNAMAAYSEVPIKTILLSNAFALCWGVANVLWGLCIVRIGMALSGAILTGLGVSVGVTLPMILKGSGLFGNAAGLDSSAGKAVMIGVAVMLIGVVLASLAGFGRDRALQKQDKKSGSFLGGLIMAAIAGITSAGIGLAFVYGQGPIVSAMKAHGAGDIPANLAVWAVGLIGGTLVNIGYPVYLLCKNKSWGVFSESPREALLASIIGIQLCLAIALMGRGMLMLGALGASVGFGIQQASQMIGGQSVGFISGEWLGVHGAPRKLMYATILVLIVAAIIMAYGNTLV
ncbi:MAG: L-rhamnose/proton symporter RhaT [Armatimonadota bacterium]